MIGTVAFNWWVVCGNVWAGVHSRSSVAPRYCAKCDTSAVTGICKNCHEAITGIRKAIHKIGKISVSVHQMNVIGAKGAKQRCSAPSADAFSAASAACDMRARNELSENSPFSRRQCTTNPLALTTCADQWPHAWPHILRLGHRLYTHSSRLILRCVRNSYFYCSSLCCWFVISRPCL